jgi:hypothetical protein
VLRYEDAVEIVVMVLQAVEISHDVTSSLKNSNYFNLHEGKENNEERRSMDTSKENQEMEESTKEETRGLEVSEKKQDQWEQRKDTLNLEVSEENRLKVEDESGDTLGFKESELKEMELSAQERPIDTNIQQVSHSTIYCEYACRLQINTKCGCDDRKWIE